MHMAARSTLYSDTPAHVGSRLCNFSWVQGRGRRVSTDPLLLLLNESRRIGLDEYISKSDGLRAMLNAVDEVQRRRSQLPRELNPSKCS
jgi:hypothetical protein